MAVYHENHSKVAEYVWEFFVPILEYEEYILFKVAFKISDC